MKSTDTSLSQEEINYWVSEYPELDRQEIIELIELIELIDATYDNDWYLPLS